MIVSNDFIQYYLGAWIAVIAATDDAVSTLPFKGSGGPFGSTAFTLNGGDSADNQGQAQTFVTTASVLPGFPQFNSSRAIGFDRPPSYDPPEGTKYAYAKSSDESWQRLRRTIDLTGNTTGALKFKISYDTELDYDYVFVEAHTVGQDDWTTLPDKNGHTDTNVAAGSCDIDWDTVHPFVSHYQTNPTPANDCTEHRHDRRVERRHRQLRRLPGLGDRPERLQGQAGRGLDHLRAGLRRGRSRRVPRRAAGGQGRRGERVAGLRGRPRPVGRRPAARRHRERGDVGRERRRSASPTVRASPPRTRCCGASASRA